MFFLVDTNKKIIFGWSAKCGCSHIKTIFWFLQSDNFIIILLIFVQIHLTFNQRDKENSQMFQHVF